MPRLTIEQPVLLSLLSRVAPFVGRRSTIPILECVRITVGDDLAIAGTCLDIDATARTMDFEHEGAGAVCLPVHRLRLIAWALDPALRVTLSWPDEPGGKVEIISGEARYSLAAYNADDFPPPPSGEYSHAFTVPAPDLRLLLTRGAFAISREETRYYLNGLFITEHEGKLRGVTTDGHRMVVQDIALPEGAAGMPGVILPDLSRNMVARLIGAKGANGVGVEVGPQVMRFTLGGLSVVTRLIDSKYVDYRRIIPADPPCCMKVEPRHMLASLKRARAMANYDSYILKIEPSAGAINVSLENRDIGTVSERMLVEGGGKAAAIGMNVHYLMQALAAHHSDEAEILIGEPGSPSIIRGDAGCFTVQMSARV